MRHRIVLALMVAAAVFAGCTAQPPADGTDSVGGLTAGDSFLAAETTEGGIAPLEHNIVRPGDRFLVVLQNVTGLEEDGNGEYSFEIGVEVVEEPSGDELYSRENVADERNETVVDGTLRFTDVGIDTPPSIEYGTYSVRVTVYDRVGNRKATVEESLIVSAEEGEPS